MKSYFPLLCISKTTLGVLNTSFPELYCQVRIDSEEGDEDDTDLRICSIKRQKEVGIFNVKEKTKGRHVSSKGNKKVS